jgi:hypothetical protein
MDDIGNVVAINDDSISITTQGSQHIYNIPKSHVEGYDGAEVFLDLSAAEMSNYDINSKSQDNIEKTITAAKSAAEASSTTTQTQIPTNTSWIYIYKEFAINAAKLSEYWFNLFGAHGQKSKEKTK